jgi:Leishmanolysin
VNVCLDNIVLNDDGSATAADSVVQDYLDVTIHEVGHVLGHSSNSYRFYWDPDTGEPRTPRPFEAQTVTCVNNVERTMIVPAENTLQFVETNGQRYAAIVTDKVKAVARNQFDCQSLAGAFLENEPTREDSCIGDHWDERLFYPEAMSPVISPTTNIFSALTLALMEDSGWYRSNYSVSNMNPWGLGVGCDFVDKPCLLPQSGASPQIPEYGRGFFCNSESTKGCSSELTHKMACTVIDYQYYVPQTSPPEQFSYFLDSPTMGGPQQADYCPVFGSPYSSETTDQLDCRNPDNAEQFLNAYEYVLTACFPITSFLYRFSRL